MTRLLNVPGSRILGIDAGTRHTGLGAIYVDDEGQPRAGWCKFVKTTDDHSAIQEKGRAADDQRRLHEVIDPILEAVSSLGLNAIAYEEYTTYDSTEMTKVKKSLKELLREAADFGIIETDSGKRFTRAPVDECFDLIEKRLDEIRRALQGGNAFVGTRGRGRATRTLTVVGAVITAARAYQIQSIPHYAGQLKHRFPGQGKDATILGVRSVLAGTDELLDQAGIPHADRNHVYDAWGHALLAAGF